MATTAATPSQTGDSAGRQFLIWSIQPMSALFPERRHPA